MVKALIHATLYDYESFQKDVYVLFDKQIFEIGPMKEFINHDYEIINCEKHVVIPNFVLSHTHIYSAFARGLSLPFNPHNFQEILDQLWWKMDKQIDNDITFASGIVYGSECLKRGITTLIDHHASNTDIYGSLSALRRAIVDTIGLRGAFCFETSDRFDVPACIKENIDFSLTNHSSHARGLFGLHASMSVSESTLKAVKDALGDSPIHIHVAESLMDQEDSLAKYHETVIERLDRHQLLNKNSLLVHCVHVSDHDLDIIKARDAQIVVNVTSNMNNGVGLPDIQKMMDKGIRVLVGNDGLSASITNEYQAIYFLSHLKAQSPSAMSISGIIPLILAGYTYANTLFGIKIGRFLPKYDADFQIIPYIPPTPMNASNAFGHLFFGLFDSFRPKHVYVGGVQLLKYYQIEKNLETLVESAVNQAEILWDRLKQEAK